MALSDEVIARYPAQVLVEVTNPRDPSASSNGTTLLDQAAASIQNAWFKQYAQQEYDSTDAMHVEVAVDGVMALLFKWGATLRGVARTEWETWVAAARDLASVSSRARIVPTTNSELTPSDENPTGGIVRPWGDPTHFAGLVLGGSPDPDPDTE